MPSMNVYLRTKNQFNTYTYSWDNATLSFGSTLSGSGHALAESKYINELIGWFFGYLVI